MTSDFWLKWNSLCGDLPTELASLPDDLDRQEITKGNFIGSPCLPSSSADNSNTQTGGISTIILVLGAVAIAIMVLAAVASYAYTTHAKDHTSNNDNDDSVSRTTQQTRLLDDSNTLNLDSNSGIDVEADGVKHGLQLQSLAPLDQPHHLARAWQRSSAQLVVLDHELRVVLWSEGMAKATSSFTPAHGTGVEGLPFPSVSARRTAISALESGMGERSAEGEAALHPTLALQAAVTTAPNVSLHLVTPLHIGVRDEVLLLMTAVKMKPLATAASSQGFENEPCHLLIMGLESFDPGLASLWRESNPRSSPPSISDLTSENSENGAAGELTNIPDSSSVSISTDSSSASMSDFTWQGVAHMTGEEPVDSGARPTGPRAAAAAGALAVLGVLGDREPGDASDVTVNSSDTAYILEGQLLQVAQWAVQVAAGSTDPPPSCAIDSSDIQGRRL
jgi:hypothetical protein